MYMKRTKKDLKLLFVNPCLRPGGYTKILPVGLASVMTYFKENGYEFTLLDTDINEFDDAYVENFIEKNEFDFVLLGSIVTHYKWIKWFVNMTKDHQPNTKIVAGNSVAGSIPKLFLEKTKADIVVCGEGEISAYEAVEAVRQNKELKDVPGIAFRNVKKEFVETPARKAAKIDTLPLIDWSIFDVERYLSYGTLFPEQNKSKKESDRAMPIVTARGCAFKCTFCHYVFWNDPYRNRDPKSIVKEIKQLQEKYDIKYFNFWDDLTFASAKQADKLCDEIIKSGLKIKWVASIRVDIFSRANLSYEESLKVANKMKQSGCYDVGFALESGNQEILEMMNKKIEADAFYNTCQILKDVGITVQTSLVFGYPIETKETIKQTFDQCLKARVYPSIGFLLPLPYTVMYDYAKANGFITDEDAFLESITERQDICINMTKMSDDEIMTEIKNGARKLNEMLELGLTEETYIKTKTYQGSKDKKKLKPIDPENIKRIRNDVSFNYSASEFKFEEQIDSE